MLKHSTATILSTGVALLALVTLLGCPAPSDAARTALNGTGVKFLKDVTLAAETAEAGAVHNAEQHNHVLSHNFGNTTLNRRSLDEITFETYYDSGFVNVKFYSDESCTSETDSGKYDINKCYEQDGASYYYKCGTYNGTDLFYYESYSDTSCSNMDSWLAGPLDSCEPYKGGYLHIDYDSYGGLESTPTIVFAILMAIMPFSLM